MDSAGNLYIVDTSNSRIRRVSNGTITTVAGTVSPGFNGDNLPATSAAMYSPEAVAFDSAGDLYIADAGNQRVREVANGVITTVAGTGVAGFSGDGGAATNAQFRGPAGAAVDSAGNLYITDYGNSRVRKITNGVITTVAGNGTQGYSGDYGPATSAELCGPTGIALDSAGRAYIADSCYNRVRVLTPTGPTVSPLTTGVTNAGSNLPGPIAPGEMVVLSGVGLGPAQLTSASVGSDGLYGRQLSGTSVEFSGIAAPILYTWAGQVAAVVPYEVGGSSAQVTFEYQGQTSAPLRVAVEASAPGLFTLSSTGSGQAAAVNQDGSINTALNPARIGSVISFYGTGEGETSPPGIDGKPASDSPPTPNLPVTVTIGGVTISALQYVGGARGEIAGVLQINVQIPSGVRVGSAIPVSVQVGSMTSQSGVTVAVSDK